MRGLGQGKYRHYKGGEYRVLGIAKHSETKEELVVYEALYGEGAMWVRPKNMFFDRVHGGKAEVQRFEYIGD